MNETKDSRERTEGDWRCGRCGHGEKLTAWAQANVYGRLLADGSVEESYSDQHTLFEESIECSEHMEPRSRLQRWFQGRWTRLEPCDGTAERYDDTPLHCVEGQLHRVENDWGASYGYCQKCNGSGEMWVPIEESCHA